jgi:hypothetical protein
MSRLTPMYTHSFIILGSAPPPTLSWSMRLLLYYSINWEGLRRSSYISTDPPPPCHELHLTFMSSAPKKTQSLLIHPAYQWGSHFSIYTLHSLEKFIYLLDPLRCHKLKFTFMSSARSKPTKVDFSIQLINEGSVYYSIYWRGLHLTGQVYISADPLPFCYDLHTK